MHGLKKDLPDRWMCFYPTMPRRFSLQYSFVVLKTISSLNKNEFFQMTIDDNTRQNGIMGNDFPLPGNYFLFIPNTALLVLHILLGLLQ